MKYPTSHLTPFPPTFPGKITCKRILSAKNSARAPAIPLSTFRINTCKSVSKQRTLSPSRMNTYAKTRGRGASHAMVQSMSATRPTLHRERRRSREIFDRAAKLLVGGVNSPVRAFRSVGGDPLIIERGEGQYLYDADGNQLLATTCS